MTDLAALLQDFYLDKLRMMLTDLLGRRAEQLDPAHGEVLPSRWIE